MEKKNDPLTTSLPEYVEVEEYGKDVGMVWMENTREIMMGVGDGVASVIMLTFTSEPCPMLTFPSEPCPHADTAWAVIG